MASEGDTNEVRPPGSEPVEAAGTPEPEAASRSRRKQSLGRRVARKLLNTLLLLVVGALPLVVALFLFSGKDEGQQTITDMIAPIRTDARMQQDLPRVSPPLYAYVNDPGFVASVYEDPSTFSSYINAIPDKGGTVSESNANSYVKSYFVPMDGIMKAINADLHSAAGNVMMVLLVLAALLGASVVMLSRGYWRALSPGISIAIVSWPLLLILTIVQSRLNDSITQFLASAETAEEKASMDLFIKSVRPSIDSFLQQALTVSRLFSILALLLLGGTGVAFLINRVRHRAHHGVQIPAGH